MGGKGREITEKLACQLAGVCSMQKQKTPCFLNKAEGEKLLKLVLSPPYMCCRTHKLTHDKEGTVTKIRRKTDIIRAREQGRKMKRHDWNSKNRKLFNLKE